jgi:ABC-2 type transport system ATP-binding protein
MITTHEVTKRFGRVEAVRGVSLDVREGDRYGLLGPNGSGKSTLVRMLLGLVYATSGSISVLGEPIPRRAGHVLPSIGALIEEPAAYPHLSGRANLRLLDAAGPHSARRGRKRRVDEALDQVGLGGIDRRPVRAYSLGMRQRLGLAAALVRRPRLLILDEPTNGLDPRGIRDIRELLISLNATGTTIFLSSHLLPEVAALCTRVGVLDSGRLVLQDDLPSLEQPTGRVLISTHDPERAVATLDGQVEHRSGENLVVRAPDPAALNARLVEAGVRVRSLAQQRRTLEEIVLEVTGAGSDQFGVPQGDPAPSGSGSAPGSSSAPAPGPGSFPSSAVPPDSGPSAPSEPDAAPSPAPDPPPPPPVSDSPSPSAPDAASTPSPNPDIS